VVLIALVKLVLHLLALTHQRVLQLVCLQPLPLYFAQFLALQLEVGLQPLGEGMKVHFQHAGGSVHKITVMLHGYISLIQALALALRRGGDDMLHLHEAM
jgi:hypothetical protein